MRAALAQLGMAFNFQVNKQDSPLDPGKSWGEKQMEGNNFYRLASKKEVEKDGVKGTRWEYAPGEPSAGTVIYYYFTRNDFSYSFTINLNGAVSDKLDITEWGQKIMETFRFIN